MPSDSDFGRFITGRQFSERVKEVVEEAVSDLEQRGFTPVYDHADERDDNQESKHASR
jgi:hypothetical protein